LDILSAIKESCGWELARIGNDIVAAYRGLLLLRFDNEATMLLNVSSKAGEPLWYVTGDSFIDVVPALLTNTEVWETLVETLEVVLNPSEITITQLSRNNLEDIVKLGEALDIRLMGFLKEILVPASMSVNVNYQWKLIGLLDAGCNNYYRAFHTHENSLHKSISCICLNYLFELSKEVSRT
jgi:hypothetical protein